MLGLICSGAALGFIGPMLALTVAHAVSSDSGLGQGPHIITAPVPPAANTKLVTPDEPTDTPPTPTVPVPRQFMPPGKGVPAPSVPSTGCRTAAACAKEVNRNGVSGIKPRLIRQPTGISNRTPAATGTRPKHIATTGGTSPKAPANQPKTPVATKTPAPPHTTTTTTP